MREYTPSLEDFLQWQDQPMTQWVLKGLELLVIREQEAWFSLSWVGNQGSPMSTMTPDQLRLSLLEHKKRADAYSYIKKPVMRAGAKYMMLNLASNRSIVLYWSK